MWHALENFRPAATPGGARPLPAASPATAPAATFSPWLDSGAKGLLRESLKRRQFQERAESFLRDSLPLTGLCQTDCARINSTIAEAEQFGRLGPAGFASLSADPSLPQRFGALVADSFALLARSPAPQIARAKAPPAQPPVHIAPSVVVPLPRDIPAPAAQASASRPDRSRRDVVASVAPGTPMQQTAPAQVFGRNDGVAIYDISAHTVYMPDGQRLEAHSGLGYMVDNPRYVDRRDTGPTPPNTYDLVMRKGRFHGVEALRLLPSDGNNKYGRIGLLAHTYMLRGRPAESNGCVAFKDYERFLEAFKRGAVRRLIVVPALSGSPVRMASK